MKQFKFYLATVITLVLLLATIVTINAEGTPTITVGEASAKPGESVEIPVTVENNPGICTCSFTFTYDSTAMTLEEVTVSEKFGGNFAFSSRAVWFSTKDVTENGVFMTLHFKVHENASPGDNEIKAVSGEGDICNFNEQGVSFWVKPGILTITGEETQSTETTTSSETEISDESTSASDSKKTTAAEEKIDYDSLSDFSKMVLSKKDSATVKQAIETVLIRNDYTMYDLTTLTEEEQNEFVKEVMDELGIRESEYQEYFDSSSDKKPIEQITELYDYVRIPSEADAGIKETSNKHLIISLSIVAVCIIAVSVIVIVRKQKKKSSVSEDKK